MTDEQTEEQKNIRDILGDFSLDPATWEDPKETFPGEITASSFRLASEEYRVKTQFRPAITEELPQWDLRVKRLDAVRTELDGSQSDVYYYGGVDLKVFNPKANNGAGGLAPLSSRNQKSWSIINAHKQVFGTIQPPESLVGKIATFDFFRTKAYGTVTARRVLLPTAVLPPDFTFVGDKITFIARERDDDPATEGGDAVPEGGTAGLLGIDEAMGLIPNAIAGQNTNDVAGVIGAIPQNARLPDIVNRVATQDLQKDLAASGAIVIDESSGVISVGPNA